MKIFAHCPTVDTEYIKELNATIMSISLKNGFHGERGWNEANTDSTKIRN